MSKGSDPGFQSPPASSSSVTINTAPFQAMQTVSMKREWLLQFIVPVKPLFLLDLLLGTYYVKNFAFCVALIWVDTCFCPMEILFVVKEY